MTLSDYQINARRTCPDMGSIHQNLAHMGLGLTSELSELEDAMESGDIVNYTEEIADVKWYAANWCTFRGYDLSQFDTEISDDEVEQFKSLSWYCAELADLAKKLFAYRKEIPQTTELTLLHGLVSVVKLEFEMIEEISGITLEQALQNNIDKLKVRYPDKFSEECAINRNLEAERKELEKV